MGDSRKSIGIGDRITVHLYRPGSIQHFSPDPGHAVAEVVDVDNLLKVVRPAVPVFPGYCLAGGLILPDHGRCRGVQVPAVEAGR